VVSNKRSYVGIVHYSCTDNIKLNLTCSISIGVGYLDLWNVNKFKFKFIDLEVSMFVCSVYPRLCMVLVN
jgi:hypothetical protein